MKSLRIFSGNINMRFIDEAVEALEQGDLIIYPTDTLYAIGCDATNQRAIEHVCRLKGIDPRKQHLAIMCSDLSQAARFVRIDNRAFDIMRRNLPGPVTFILPPSTTLPKAFKGRKEVGVRIPDDDIARCLAAQLGRPLLTTSILLDNLYGDDYHAAMMELADSYSADIPLLIDSGTREGVSSAIVDLMDSTAPETLREGPLPLA
ncbi:MAG: threonylcarbamoyl-AMP synthase [Muribaculaceae bacterium]|nr:threonylcarbamoyl-AMP synthase [Muribaculaceae bacterium]